MIFLLFHLYSVYMYVLSLDRGLHEAKTSCLLCAVLFKSICSHSGGFFTVCLQKVRKFLYYFSYFHCLCTWEHTFPHGFNYKWVFNTILLNLLLLKTVVWENVSSYLQSQGHWLWDFSYSGRQHDPSGGVGSIMLCQVWHKVGEKTFSTSNVKCLQNIINQIMKIVIL